MKKITKMEEKQVLVHPRDKLKKTNRVTCISLYLLFNDVYECVAKSKFKEDENRNIDYRYFLSMFAKATEKEDLIRKLWDGRCHELLSGILIYLYKMDRYFSPQLNTREQFFIKVYKHREILRKIGSGEREIVFPFKKIFDKKKPLLIRC